MQRNTAKKAAAGRSVIVTKVRLAATLFAALFVFLLIAPLVLAVDNPDTLTLSDVSPYRDLIEAGDLLVVAEYKIAYATLPDDNADVNFIARLLQSTTTLGTNVPYPFNDGGYGLGVVSVYLSQAETQAAGFTDSAGVYSAWPISGLTFKLEGNPTVFTSPRSFTWGITSGDYSTGSGQTTNQAQLTTEVLTAAQTLESAWGATLLTSNGLLNDTAGGGGQYFGLAIPGLRQMAPDAFSVSTETPTVPTDTTASTDGTFAVTSATRFDATVWLTPAFDALADDLGMPHGSIQGVFVLIMAIVLVVMGGKMRGGQGALVGFASSALILLPVSMVLGFAPWAFGALALAGILSFAVVKIARENLN